MTPSDFAAALRRWWMVTVVVVTAAVAAFVALVLLQEPESTTFATTSRLAVVPFPDNAQVPLALSPPFERQAQLAMEPDVLATARDVVDDDLAGEPVAVSATADQTTRTISVTAVTDDPTSSLAYAEALAEAYEATRLAIVTDDLEARQRDIRDRLSSLQQRFAERADDLPEEVEVPPEETARVELLIAQVRGLRERIEFFEESYGQLVADEIITTDPILRADIQSQQQSTLDSITALRTRLNETVAQLPADALAPAAEQPAAEDGAGDAEADAATDPLVAVDAAVSVRDAQAIALRDQINGLRAEFGNVVAQAAAADDGARLIEILPTEEVTQVAGRSLLFPALLLALIALVAGLGLPLVLDRLDRTVRSHGQVNEMIGAPVLGEVPRPRRRDRRKPAFLDPQTRDAAAYRNLASTVLLAAQTVPNSILVVNVNGETASDVVSLHLAASMARLGVDTTLVGTQPDQSWFGAVCKPVATESTRGFRDLLTSDAGQSMSDIEAIRLDTVDDAPIGIVMPGSSPTGTVPARDIGRVLGLLAGDDRRTTVLAGPSVIGGTDATIFARQAGAVLWVVEERFTKLADLDAAAATMDLTGATSLGVVYVAPSG